MRIYLAAPLFTTGERDFNDAIGVRLREAGHEVVLPQDREHDAFDPARTFRRDVDHVDRSDVVVGITDGPDPDSGTAWRSATRMRRGSRSSCSVPTSASGAAGRARCPTTSC